jgi:hypothetical protein
MVANAARAQQTGDGTERSNFMRLSFCLIVQLSACPNLANGRRAMKRNQRRRRKSHSLARLSLSHLLSNVDIDNRLANLSCRDRVPCLL